MFKRLKNYLRIVYILLASLLLVSCGGTIDYGQELVTTAEGLPTWQDIENGVPLPPAPTPVNGTAPVFVTSPKTQITEGQFYRYAVGVADIDAGDKLVVRAQKLPAWLELRTTSDSTLLTGTPQQANIGTHKISLSVIDLSGLEGKQNFDLVVEAKTEQAPTPIPTPTPAPTPTPTPVNQKPTAYARQVTTQEDKAIAFTLTADDNDGDKLSYAIVSQPKQGKLTGTLPNVQYTPNANFAGNDSFVFRANDGKLNSNNATVSMTVTQVNDAPVAQNGTATTDKNKAVRVTMAATDIERQALNYSIVGNPANGSLSNAAGNAITYTPKANFVGTDRFSFRVNDAGLNSNVATISITVKETAQPTAGTYRVLVDTDIGLDPDDIQSLYRLVHYSDILKIEGILASVSLSTGANAPLVQQWIRNVRVNELRAKGYSKLMTEEALLASVRQGSTSLGGPAPGRATPGSNHIIASVRNAKNSGDNRPLYILVWGSITTVAQALHDAPDIAPYIRIYSIGGPNARMDLASRMYVFNFMQNNYKNLWWIESGSPSGSYKNSYVGVYRGGNQSGEWASGAFIGANIRGHGAAGNDFPVAAAGLQEGDSPSMLYLLSPILGGVGNVEVPSSESWGGKFVRHSQATPNYYIDCCGGNVPSQESISKWRVQYLSDWKGRWDRYQ